MPSETRFESFDILPRDYQQLPPTTTFPLSDYDQILSGNHTTPVCVYKFDGDRDDLVKHLQIGLQNVLTCIPILGGTLRNGGSNRMSVVRENHTPIQLGAHYLDAKQRSSFPSYADLAAKGFPATFFTENAAQLVAPGANLGGRRFDDGCPVAAFQANFVAGGVMLVIALYHACGDARSIDHVFTLWAASTKAAAKALVPPKFEPSMDRTYFNAGDEYSPEELETARASLKGFAYHKLDPAKPTGYPPLPPTSLVFYHFPSAKLAELKKLCMPAAGLDVKFVSSYDCVAALSWRAMLRARLSQFTTRLQTTKSVFGEAVDTRGRFPGAPPLSYFGNAFNLTGSEAVPLDWLVADNTLPEVAQTVRRCTQSVDVGSIPRTLRLRKTIAGEEDMRWDVRPENAVATSWMVMRPMEKYDFGFGLPMALRLPVPIADGMAGVLPASRNKSGVSDGFDVFIAIEKDSAENFARDSEWNAYCTVVGG